MICSKCNQDKDPSSFYLRKDNGKLRAECKICFNEKSVVWQKKNREKVRGYVRKSCKAAYDRDPEFYREKKRISRNLNPEKSRMIVRKSYAKVYQKRYDSERARLNANSAARRRAAPSWLTAIQKAQIMEFYDIARCLTVQTGIQHDVDHIMPIKGEASSGLHVPWNLQILTKSENCAKKNKVEA
jgi:hypothetical protein